MCRACVRKCINTRREKRGEGEREEGARDRTWLDDKVCDDYAIAMDYEAATFLSDDNGRSPLFFAFFLWQTIHFRIVFFGTNIADEFDLVMLINRLPTQVKGLLLETGGVFVTATTVAVHESGLGIYTTQVGLRPPILVYGSSGPRYKSGRGHVRVLVREVHDVIRGGANTDGLVVIIGSDAHDSRADQRASVSSHILSSKRLQ
ncbi:hypothetical protein EDB85DRAFT_613472 [Lactarius pseudohatsudake]|nr:hypothetical protein EDB85DRAFT_613472 [Lactarius pseudohatsudake]